MKRLLYVVTMLVALMGFCPVSVRAQSVDETPYRIRKTDDFTMSGRGDHANWNRTGWTPITVQESANRPLGTKTKVLYSDKGLYFLFQCDDQQLTATIQEDFGALFKEDVVEVFIRPNQSVPIYIEYELSPLNHELIILVPNINGRAQGWKPWNYRPETRVQHAVSVQGGNQASSATVSGWTAEFFIPYRAMSPLVSAPPQPGTQWRGNLYRIDYDKGYQTWSWRKTSGSFHEFEKFGIWQFE